MFNFLDCSYNRKNNKRILLTGSLNNSSNLTSGIFPFFSLIKI